MTEENRIENTENKHECICKSKGFRKFLTIALGTFVGVYCALSLFTALHRPPMMTPCLYGGPMPRPMVQCPCGCTHHNFDRQRDFRGDFHKKMMKHRMENNAPRPVQEADD